MKKTIIFILIAVSLYLPEGHIGAVDSDKKAIREYKKLADNNDIEGYLNLAVIFKDLGHYDRAIRILNRAYLEFGQDLKVLSLLGRLYYLNNQPDEAVVTLGKVLEIKPDDLDAHINLGLCYTDKGEDEKAKNYYERASSLSKNNVVARLLLAELYYRKGKLQEAIEEYKAVNLIDASIINIQKILGELFYRLGNLQEALRAYQKIALIEPQNKLANNRINEISQKLGKEYFEKERQKKALFRRQKIVLVKAFPKVKDIVFVRVGLMKGKNLVEFQCSSTFEVRTKLGRVSVATGQKGQSYQISRNDIGRLIISNQDIENIIVDGPIIIKPINPEGAITLFNVRLGEDNFWATQEDRSYRGSIEINADASGITIVDIVNLEEYLYGVVPSEMPANWPGEALRAQTVACRTEAMAKLGRHKNEGYDFCAGVHCQAYAGIERETEQTNRAVDETRGITMNYDGKPINAVYSSNCGGHTQDNIFGDERDIPYLRGRFDAIVDKNPTFPLSPFELEGWIKEPTPGILCGLSKYSNFRWARIYTAQEINEMLTKVADLGEIRKIVVLKRKRSGHLSAIKIIGTRTSYTLEKELNIRQALGNLRSSMFKVEVKYGPDKKPQQFIFYGGGWGHGVGMCQSGAYGMANLGKNYKEILSHYFQGIKFKKIY